MQPVWDLPVRLFHWVLTAAAIGSFATNRLGVAYFKYHVLCGCTVLVLVLFRIVWGFVGSYHARFSSFVCGPAAILRYLRRLQRGDRGGIPGHNPLGALMILFLLAGFLIQAIAGLFATDDIFDNGPLYGWAGHQLSLELSTLHRRLFYVLLGAVGLHVFAALLHSVRGPENLIRAMITGRKADAGPARPIASTWFALAIVAVLAAALAWILAEAPPANNGG